MDNPGWSAFRRAERESQQYAGARRGEDGRFVPVEIVPPLNESFIGGFNPYGVRPTTPTPPVPPKDIGYRPGESRLRHAVTPSIASPDELLSMSAIQRSHVLRIPRMNPNLQFMVGPLLGFDTIDNGVWRGAVMIVTADSGSTYDPHPMLCFEWDPDIDTAQLRQVRPSVDLGPHPSDPRSTLTSAFAASQFSAVVRDVNKQGNNARSETVPGHELYVYGGTAGTFTFWRFAIEIPLGRSETAVSYSINNGQAFVFFVPGANQNMRWAGYSCNGFSAGVNPDDFRGPGFQSGYDPVWQDLLAAHAEEPFHALVGGGDQIYCDSITREPELQEWNACRPEERLKFELTAELSLAIDRFYFNHYCSQWRSGAFARANSSIPMMNMADDHDIIDGFGSYPDDLQMAPVFRAIGARGYFFFLLFQCFVNPAVDGADDKRHFYRSLIIGNVGPFVKQPSHSFLANMGPQTWMLLLDCRGERRKKQVCSEIQYDRVFDRLNKMPVGVKHLCVQLGIPIAYPRMNFLETALGSKFNPIVALGKARSMGFINKFNGEAEILDDLNDHWTSHSHKRERNWLVEKLQAFAKSRHIRVTFLSGDVHCAAVGLFKTLVPNKAPDVKPAEDHRYMLNVVTSAIVNTPPPNAVITMVSSLGSKNHRTMHHVDTDEIMVPLFDTETNGKPRKQKFIMGQRNYTATVWDPSTGDWVFSFFVEKEKGGGQTMEYTIRAPPPSWA